jgi:hypothetical protein
VSIPRVQWVHLAWGIFGLVSIFVYCLFGVSTLSNQRRDFISSRPIKLQKGQNFQKFQNFKILQYFFSKISCKISKFSKNLKIMKSKFFFLKVQNFQKISKFNLKKKIKIFIKFQNFQKFHKISKFSSYFKILIFK